MHRLLHRLAVVLAMLALAACAGIGANQREDDSFGIVTFNL